ncbi:hypothetical protein BH23ACT7_BH23ACT7_17550 [soil metagenome]|jgi:ParB family chromosome partitioning protein
MTRASGLGRGLGALIPVGGPGQSGLLRIALDAVDPNPQQPRALFDDEALAELTASIRDIGVLQPIVVRPGGPGRYEIVAGERRWRAARAAGLSEIPAVVRHTEDGQMLTEALVENIHRADLGPLEEAAAYQQLLDDFGMTHEALADRLGKSRSAVTNALRLLLLPPTLQRKVEAGILTAGHARALLGLPTPEAQDRAAQRVAMDGLSVRATEDLVRRLAAEPDGESAAAELAAQARGRRASPFLDAQRRLADALGTRVEIRGTARRGRVVIDYAGEGDLERLLSVVGRGTGADVLEG